MRTLLIWGLVCAGCAAHAPVPSSSPSPELKRAGEPVPQEKAPVPAPPTAAPTPAATPAPPTLKLDVQQVLTAPVTAIGLGEGTRVGVLAEQPYVGDAGGLRPLPLPASLMPKEGERDELGIYFGRDNEPRIMGTRHAAAAERGVYFRHLPNGWRDGREEIGQLGGAVPGGLWGVLGSADPELVCRAGSLCIIKRVTGWTLAPAGSHARSITLQGGVLWGLDESGISGIDRKGWLLAIPAPAAANPTAFWATSGEAWLGTASELQHYVAGAWRAQLSPVGSVSAFWGLSPSSVWVVGARGAAHFDGHGFSLVSVAGPLRAVLGRAGEVWFGGDAGLFRAHPPG